MAIAFSCPQCGKSYKVKDELAGKPVNCKDCSTPVRVPFRADGPAVPVREVESLASAALAETEQEAAAAALAAIEFECPNCIETVKLDARFAGKQAPCPNCRRIVRVPQLADPKARNWRAADHRPTLAKTADDPKMAGAWGNATSTRVVSRDALAEADALRKRRPAPAQSPILRWIAIGCTVAAVALGSMLYRSHRSANRRDDCMERALALLAADEKAPPAIACEVHRAHAEYQLHSESRQAVQADKSLRLAREALLAGEVIAPIERTLLLTEIALTQAGLGGDKPQADAGSRLAWGDVQKEMRRTLSHFERDAGVNDGIILAYQRLAGRLGLQGDGGPIVAALVSSVYQSPSERLEPLATVALEFIGLGEAGREKALELAAETRTLFSTAAASGTPIDNVPAKLIALHVALQETAKLPQAQEPSGGEPTAAMRLGFVEGYARRGEFDRARTIARLPGRFEDRFAAHAIVGSLADAADAQADLSGAVDLLDKELRDRDLPEWSLILLAQACARAPAANAGKVLFESLQRMSNLSPRSQTVRAWALYELLRGGVSGIPATEPIVKKIGPDGAAGRLLAWGALGRRLASSADVDAWPAAIRAVALAGVALGLQDGK